MYNRHWHFPALRPAFALLLLTLFVPIAAPALSPTLSRTASPTITVPFDLVSGHIILKVMLDGKGPYWFALDTGAYNCLTAQTAEALGVTERRTRLASVQIGPLALADQPFAVLPLPDIQAVEGLSPFGGLIGAELFRQYVVKVDYERQKLTLTPPDMFQAPVGAVDAHDLTFLGQTPQIKARLDGVEGTFNIDTGDRRSLAIFRDFRDRCLSTGSAVQAMTGWGVRGPVWSGLGRAQTFQIGDAVIQKPLLEFDEARGGAFDFRGAAGNIGGSLLEQFDVTFDYSRRRVFFEKNARFGQPILWDRSGLWLNQSGTAFRVMDVTPDSPAAQAGVGAGDTVLAVDGRPSGEVSLPALRQILRQTVPGIRVRLTVRSGANLPKRDVTLVLRDLV